ncbi:sensory box sensor histidine kinase [Marinobacter santoriniensis NKSG1]|uniref:Sensory box sensor histidine kinase n=1 Tax=Marinobacter santoriniensis NKSG1 TaxID=1288826 RepID=M7CLK8_9GAMM|nr:methyl-accepting chemotaxis protein [Marinobacter santoriniensis]EMP54516.1 sensory box sensor histidine kinase [Marinobacter santoriniensis NKSG1]
MKLSLRTQAVIGIGVIEVVMLVVLLYSVFHFIHSSTREEVDRRAQSIARIFASTSADDVLSLDLGSLKSFVNAAALTPGTAFARVVDYEGRLLAEGGNREALMLPFEETSALKELPNIYMARADIVKAGTVYGSVEIGLDVRKQKLGISTLKDRSLMIAIVEVLTAALFSIAAGYYLVRRLSGMRRVVQRAVAGEASARITEPFSDEVSDLADEIDRLVERYEWEKSRKNERILRLEELNQLLHKKIAEIQRRT